MLEFEKFLLYLNENVSPAIGLLLLLSTTRTIVTTMTVIHPGFLYYTIDAHSFIVIMLLVQWASVSIAPLISVRTFIIEKNKRQNNLNMFLHHRLRMLLPQVEMCALWECEYVFVRSVFKMSRLTSWILS